MFERTFRIRRHECDAYGHLNNAGYVELLDDLEHMGGAATEASLRALDVEYLTPVGHDHEVTLTASGQPSPRSYTYVTEDGETVARATAWWANEAGVSPDVPPAGDPAPEVFVHDRTIRWPDLDPGRRVGPGRLLSLAEEAGVAVCDHFGWPMQRCTDAGLSMVLRRHQVLFTTEVGEGMVIRTRTWASDRTRVTSVRHYLMEDAATGTPVARFRSHYVWLDAGSGRPMRIPDVFLDDFRSNFAD